MSAPSKVVDVGIQALAKFDENEREKASFAVDGMSNDNISSIFFAPQAVFRSVEFGARRQNVLRLGGRATRIHYWWLCQCGESAILRKRT